MNSINVNRNLKNSKYGTFPGKVLKSTIQTQTNHK